VSDIRDPLRAERLLTTEPDVYHTRRDFLRRTAVTAGLAAGMGLVLDPDTLVAEAARRQRQVQIPSPRNLPIDTFVVLMMENRSFDHYLGWLPGADGRQAGLSFTDRHGVKQATHRLQGKFNGCGFARVPRPSWWLPRPTPTQTLCVFLEDSDVGRVFAHDESGQVDVSRPCTTGAARYDRAEKALKRAQRQLRHTKRKGRRRSVQRTIAKRRMTANRYRRAARKACGPGVTLCPARSVPTTRRRAWGACTPPPCRRSPPS
jgi:hypothetical protein